MIDNLEKVKPFLQFKSEHDFYYLQILQRKKENPELGSNSRVIKNYYIYSIDYLENKYSEIKGLCNQFNARAMLRLNKRDSRKVALKALSNMTNCMCNDDYFNMSNQYDRACGQNHNAGRDKTWILDLDNKVDNPVTEEFITMLAKTIELQEPIGWKVQSVIPSINGYHVITKPFDVRGVEIFELDIHKDNPTNLYIP